ncbi:TRAP transporter small permease [Roseitranquillus sediminis]|uniref:TRAP transporter small permease n=1 Tax=Roseitranquillus sediminis TaxID=2809051 RepID=UPI001D0C46C4|nr:TRAP transporter small permease subunit [Roseitranquillus sediminis]MBM9595660.1 TRAP transporter small permease subunit [Roseitranquillus sediminis]
MTLLKALLWPLEAFNDAVLPLGRMLAVAALALMVIVTLLQVFFRYVLGDALPWPDEAARFLMLWMTGLIAPLAYRQGGFVAIDMVERALPRPAAAALALTLLLISLAVLVTAVWFGWRHVNSGWLFASSSLRLPLDWFGGETVRLKLAWMYLSIWTGMVLLTIVNVELILRALVTLAGGQPKPLAHAALPEAE